MKSSWLLRGFTLLPGKKDKLQLDMDIVEIFN